MRQPQGVVTRPIPDWNFERLTSASASGFAIANDTYGAAGLFNDATDGSSLVIWDVEVQCDQTGTQLPRFIRQLFIGGHLATGPQPTGMLWNSQPQGYGSFWYDTNFNNPHGEIAAYPLRNGVWQWEHDWPFAIVPPGMSCVMVTDHNGMPIFGVTMIWESVLNP